MRKYLTLAVLVLIFLACQNTGEDKAQNEDGTLPEKAKLVQDTTPRVTGIGGLFFAAADPQATRTWYGKHLGLAIDPYGSPFEYRNANNPDEINYLRWSPFKKGSTFAAPSEKEWIINYRVNNIEGLVRNLKAAGVEIIDSIMSYEYGKFVHIMDPEGNKIELWEANDAFFTKMGGATTK